MAAKRLAWQVSDTGVATFAEPQRPIRLITTRHGRGSVRFPADQHADKPGTDVIMLAQAHPPTDEPVKDMEVSLRVEAADGPLHKRVRVYGPRVFMKKLTKVAPGPAAELTEPLPLAYEFAEGGSDESAPDGKQWDKINPVGTGFAHKRAALVGQEAYRIELIGGSKPAGFAAIAPQWSPRVEHYGLVDDAYYKRRHPVAPKDFDTRFNCCGHPDLWSETPLRGDEPIEVIGATPEGEWRFRLPYYEPCFYVHIDGVSERYATHLDTLLIDIENPAERIVELTWRVSVRLPRKSERLDKIVMTNAHDVDLPYYDTSSQQEPTSS